MRVGVVSDSHGHENRVKQAVEQMGKIDALLHLGDGERDALALHLSCPVLRVRGNCDLASQEPDRLLVELGGRKVLVTHGHLYGVKSGVEQLAAHARDCGAALACFGHTHRPLCSQLYGVILLNPGALRGMEPRYAVVEIGEDTLRPQIFRLL